MTVQIVVNGLRAVPDGGELRNETNIVLVTLDVDYGRIRHEYVDG